MTRGGPSHATEVLSTWGFFQAFSANNVGYGSAMASDLTVGRRDLRKTADGLFVKLAYQFRN